MAADWAPVILLAFAVSFDGLGVGVTYGLRGIRLSPFSVALICSLSAGAAVGGMMAGDLLAALLPRHVARGIGAVFFIALGCWVLLESYLQNIGTKKGVSAGRKAGERIPAVDDSYEGEREQEFAPATRQAAVYPRLVTRIRIRSLGVVIQVLREPQMMDLNRSGVIETAEALALGAVLGLDALAVGLGASMSGYGFVALPVTVGVMKLVFLKGGELLGRGWMAELLRSRLALLPAAILILLGVSRIWGA